jgi:hypothetical protein
MAELVQLVGNVIRVRTNSLDEAKMAIKELKLMKKQYALSKRTVGEEQKRIRAQYTQEVRSRGSMMRGGGGIGRFVRDIQSGSRDNRKARLASDLAPLEQKKQEIETVIRAIDSTIIQVEAAIIKQGG